MANSSAVATALRDAGVSITEDELDERIAEAVHDLLGWHRPYGAGAELTAGERAILAEGGFDVRERDSNEANPALVAAERYAALLASAMTVAEAAQRLGVDGSRVRQRLLARQLFGIRRSRGWLLPRFQFADGGMVPGIDEVLPRLSNELHPLAVVNWFLLPHPDLFRPDDPDETPISPREWLLLGGRPRVLAELAEDAAGYV